MYSSSLCKRFQFQPLVLSTRVRALVHSKPQLGFVPYYGISSQQPIVRFFSTSLDQKQSFTVSYLVNSIGLSLESATSVSNKVNFNDPKNADAVLSMLRSYGFTNTHITKFVRKHPMVLVSDPEKTLLPKFEFLKSIFISSNDLVNFVCLNPIILRRSLEKRLIPLYEFLKNILCDDEKVAKAFRRLGRLAASDVQMTLAPNIAFMRQLGVPESSILSFLTNSPNAVLQERDKFSEIAKEVISVGVDLQKTKFIQAMHVYSSLSKSTRAHKMDVYKRCGWSEFEITCALKNYPIFLACSEKKIMSTTDFLVNKMGYQTAELARYPLQFLFDLEKRIIPRCLVIKVLLLKGMLHKNLGLSTLLGLPEKQFLERFVTKYQDDIPRLLNFYQGNMSLLELGFSYEEVCGLKRL